MKQDLRQFLESLFASSPLNRLPMAYGGGTIFGKPLIGVAAGDDPIFRKLKDVVGPEHLSPAEMWIRSGLPDTENLAARLRTVSIVFPYVDRIREESKGQTELPAEIYCVGRNYANAFMNEVLGQTVAFFEDRGFRAMAGMLSPAFQIVVSENPVRIYSVWSERHMAFAAGLGTFSLHEGLITDVGCNVRITSVLTEAPLAPTPRKTEDPYAYCLHYSRNTCRKCAERCPGDAIREAGHDKVKCYLYGRIVEEKMAKRLGGMLKPHRRVINGSEQISYPVGCAFCQFDVPCMDRNPVREPRT